MVVGQRNRRTLDFTLGDAEVNLVVTRSRNSQGQHFLGVYLERHKALSPNTTGIIGTVPMTTPFKLYTARENFTIIFFLVLEPLHGNLTVYLSLPKDILFCLFLCVPRSHPQSTPFHQSIFYPSGIHTIRTPPFTRIFNPYRTLSAVQRPDK